MTEMKIYLQPHDGSGRVILCESHEEMFAAIEKLRAEGVYEITRTRGDVICDFCSHPEVRWFYTITSGSMVKMGDVAHVDSDGKWGACEVCNSHIQAREWDALADRSLVSFEKLHGPTGMPVALMQFSIAQAHGHFRRLWDGSPSQPVTPDKDFLRDAGIEPA
jgi:hypothetical protein